MSPCNFVPFSDSQINAIAFVLAFLRDRPVNSLAVHAYIYRHCYICGATMRPKFVTLVETAKLHGRERLPELVVTRRVDETKERFVETERENNRDPPAFFQVICPPSPLFSAKSRGDRLHARFSLRHFVVERILPLDSDHTSAQYRRSLSRSARRSVSRSLISVKKKLLILSPRRRRRRMVSPFPARVDASLLSGLRRVAFYA